MSALHWRSIESLATAIRQRKLSPVELTEAYLSRIEALNPGLAAFIAPTPDLARRRAKEAEAEITSGQWRGPLHGIPFALKDIIDYAGLETTCHSKILIGNVAKAHAFVSAQLEKAGAIMLGKLATHEFAFGGPSFDLPWPPAINPWGEMAYPGGSSSGSGVALAAGMTPMALGSDTAGSVRNPATACGITGLKPTYGRVSLSGVFPLAYSMDHVGPMTRGVRDNAMMMQVIAGHDSEDPTSANEVVPDFSATLDDGVKGLRIGLIRHFYTEDAEAHPAQANAVEEAARLFAKLGAEVREIRLPPHADFAAVGRLIIRSEAYAVHRPWLAERPDDYGDIGRARIMDGATLSAADYIDAQRFRARLSRQTNAAFADIDVALTISSFDPPCRIDDAEAVAKTYPRQARQPFNVTGHPAISIPAGFTGDGLPLAIQIIGHAFDEATVYRVAHAYERETGWLERKPPRL